MKATYGTVQDYVKARDKQLGWRFVAVYLLLLTSIYGGVPVYRTSLKVKGWFGDHITITFGKISAGSYATGTLTSSSLLITSPVVKLTKADVNGLFDKFNTQYFGNKLKKIPVDFADDDPNTGAYYIPGAERISLRPYLADISLDSETLRLVMLHEMSHEYIAHTFPTAREVTMIGGGHGIHWHAQMRHLAAIGAFDKLLWTQDDEGK